MATTTTKMTKVIPRQWTAKVWEEKSTLFGLLRWKRLVKATTIGEDLFIYIDRIPEKVLLNGIEYLPKVGE